MSCLINTETPGGEVNYAMTGLHPGQFRELASRKRNKAALKLKTNPTRNRQEDAGQTTDAWFQDDRQS